MDTRLLLETRARIWRQIRAFFDARDVLEVETPYASQYANTDAAIESLAVHAPDGMRYLHTSPEYPMKRLLAAGSGDIYQICKVWRQAEQGRRHHPEFSMLEWYRLNMGYRKLALEVLDLLLELIGESKVQAVRQVEYRQIFLEETGIDPHESSIRQLNDAVKEQNINLQGEYSRSELLDVLMSHVIEPGFRPDQLTVVYDFPVDYLALARVKDGVAQRFEVYYNGLELANGYQEMTDSGQNRELLLRGNRTRQATGRATLPVDEAFLRAAEQGIPECAGVAMGLDRVVMCHLAKKHINEVISFPWGMA